MSLIIKGLKVPETMIAVFISHDGKVFPVNRVYRGEDWEYVKAIQLPAHGRLIDADALLSVLAILKDKGCDGPVWDQMRDIVENMITIVPAEGGGEDG